MKEDAQPRFFAPRTHPLTLGELRRMLAEVAHLPENFVVRSKDHAPFEVFERVQELHGVEVFHATNSINLPID